jgi:ligand-binding sensor domain-containing protein
MSKFRLFWIFILFYTSIHSQNIGEWKIYSDMKNIKDASNSSEGIWAVTNGGAFRLNSSADTSFLILNKTDGLITQNLTTVAVDNQNKIWFGSQEGYIIVYNQTDKTITSILDIFKSDKTRKQINDISISRDTAFVSTDFGLTLINTNNLTFFDTFMKLGEFASESRIINTFKSGLIYTITENGVAIQKVGTQNLSVPESWNTYRFGTSISAQSATKIISFNSEILLATNNGIYKFSNGAWIQFLMQGTSIKDLFAIGSSLYILTDKSLFAYNGSQIDQVYENQNLILYSVAVRENNNYYISSSAGLIEIKNNIVKNLSPAGPYSNLFINLSVSGSGNLYVATGKDLYGIGFLEFDGKNWKRYSREDYPQLPSNAYYNVFADEDNTVYLSNWGNGVTIFKNGQFTVYNASNSGLVGIPVNTNFLAIGDVKTDTKKNVWIANHQSAARKPLSVLTNDNKWYHYSFTNPVLSEFDVLDKLVIDQYGTKWFFVYEGNRGLYYYNEKGTFENLSDDTQGGIKQSNGLLSDIITALAIDKRGYLWIGTSVGINVITDPSRPTTLISSIALALRNQSVTCIAVDALNQKWIGTKQGLFVLSSDGYQLVDFYDTKNSPLPNDDIRSIAIDEKRGKVYIGTDFGLAELQTSSIEPEDSFNEIFVYPNPLIISGNLSSQITIEGLIRNTSIKILDISGNLIREFLSPGGRVAFWDGKDLNGKFVPTGIYIIVAYDEEANNVTTSKVAVIRK